jgi:hypothetical protein
MDFMMLELIIVKPVMQNVLLALVLLIIASFAKQLMLQLRQIVYARMVITILMEILYVHNVKQNVLNAQELQDVQNVLIQL